jgi:hypothetical protein
MRLGLLTIDIEHIGERSMTKTSTPFALILAALTFVSLWAPTLHVPAATQTAAVTLPVLV